MLCKIVKITILKLIYLYLYKAWLNDG